MAMNEWLAQMYNTNQDASEEDTQKLANAELFAKIASEHNIDLESLPAEQVGELYAQVFGEETKEAGDIGDAEAHWEEKLAAEAKFAEADTMGRVMAHSFFNEFEQIKEAGIGEYAGKAYSAAKGAAGRGKELLGGSKLKNLKNTAATASERSAKHLGQGGGGGYASPSSSKALKELYNEKALKAGQAAKSEGRKVWGARAGLGAGLGAAGGGAYMSGKSKKASAEAFEELAGNHAIEIAKEAGYDADEVFTHVNAVYTLGLGESEKVAHVQDFDSGVHVRALEYLEAAGCDVNWDEVFS